MLSGAGEFERRVREGTAAPDPDTSRETRALNLDYLPARHLAARHLVESKSEAVQRCAHTPLRSAAPMGDERRL